MVIVSIAFLPMTFLAPNPITCFTSESHQRCEYWLVLCHSAHLLGLGHVATDKTQTPGFWKETWFRGDMDGDNSKKFDIERL